MPENRAGKFTDGIRKTREETPTKTPKGCIDLRITIDTLRYFLATIFHFRNLATESSGSVAEASGYHYLLLKDLYIRVQSVDIHFEEIRLEKEG